MSTMLGRQYGLRTRLLHLALSAAYKNGLAMLPMVACHVCQLLLDALIAERVRTRQPPADTHV